MANIIDRTPREYVGCRLDDGTAELIGPVFGGPVPITGDGTLQHPLRANLEVHLRVGHQFGAEVYKPACDMAQGFASIAKTETVTPVTINYMKAMGFRVIVDGVTPREL